MARVPTFASKIQYRFDSKAVNYIIPNSGTVGKGNAHFFATSEMRRLFAACQIEATIISHPRFARLPDCWGFEVVCSIIPAKWCIRRVGCDFSGSGALHEAPVRTGEVAMTLR